MSTSKKGNELLGDILGDTMKYEMMFDEDTLDKSEEEEEDDYNSDDSIEDWIDDTPLPSLKIESEIDPDSLIDPNGPSREHFKTGGLDELERDMAEFESNLALTSGIGKLSGKMKRQLTKGEIRLPAAVKSKLGIANGLYLERQYGEAIKILQSIITEYPSAHPAWNTLGLVHYELGARLKALRLRMVSAQMCNDVSLWKELAQKSIENEAIVQAIYCLSKALVEEPDDVDMLWDRSFLFKKINKLEAAEEGFSRILELMPHHFKVINELAQIYRLHGRSVEAIKMYEDAIRYHNEVLHDEEEEDEDDDFADKLGYAEVNMLSELYLMLNDYQRCVQTIKVGVRHVQNRQLETWWLDHNDDDDEYLSKPKDEFEKNPAEFPIELRVRLGICRLYLGQVDIANKHFQYLLQYPANTYPDLQQDVAFAYYDKRYYDLALPIFQRIIDTSTELEVSLLVKTGDCYRELGDLAAAALFYENVLEAHPESMDVMMSLATVYEEQGKNKEALRLVDEVMKKNKESHKLKRPERINRAKGKKEVETPDEHASFTQASVFDENVKLTQLEMARERMKQREREYQEKAYATLGLVQQLYEIEAQMSNRLVEVDVSLMRSYIRIVRELWDDFSTTSAFYPASRSSRYKGFYESRKANSNSANVALEALHMYKRLRPAHIKVEEDLDEDDMLVREEDERDTRMSTENQFRGVPFDDWLFILSKGAIMMCLTHRGEDAYEMLRSAAEANVFFHDPKKLMKLKIALLACGVLTHNDGIIQAVTRWIINRYPHSNDSYQLYSMFLEVGPHAGMAVVSDPKLKFVMRQIMIRDEIRQVKPDTNDMDQVIQKMKLPADVANEERVDNFCRESLTVRLLKSSMSTSDDDHGQENAFLLALCGQMFNISRNYVAADVFLLRSYSVNQHDPYTLLSLGIVIIQTAMQRTTDNRHEQILQGMMFINEYMDIVGECQETEYNLARVFHLLGLTHLAVNHYEKAICMPSKANLANRSPLPKEELYTLDEDDEEDPMGDDREDPTDLRMEAAYNLHLIYVTSGSPGLAQIVLSKYCVM